MIEVTMNYTKEYRPMKKRFYQLGNCFWELPISSNAIRVLGFLRSQQPGYNSSLRHIAKRIHLSVGAIQNNIAELEKMKLIKVKKVKGRHNEFYFPPDDYWAELAEPYESVQDICAEYIEEETVSELTQTVSSDNTPAEMTCINDEYTLSQPLLQTMPTDDTDCINDVDTNNTKHNTNYKTKDNTKVGRDESRQTSRRKFSFEDWHLEIATMWHGHFKRMSPYMPDQNLEKWANEIRLTAKQFSLTHEMFRAVFEFVEGDQFWSNNADSPMSLRRRNKSDIPKLTNILKAMPEYNRQRKAHETANGFLTQEQQRTRAILKEIGL
jgi:hypothetical protein